MTDADLMRAYLKGESAAFEELYRRHSGKVYGYLRSKLQSRELTDEVFQAVFLKLHQTRDNFDFKYPFSQWLFVIAKTTLLDHYRKSSRQIKTSDQELNLESVSQNTPSPSLLNIDEDEILSRIPNDQRQAVEMRVFDELSYEEIAKKLNRSQESVRQLVSRGLKSLRTFIGKPND